MPGRPGPPSGEQLQLLVEPGGDLGEGEGAQLGGDEFQRQRQALGGAADPGQRGRGPLGDGEGGQLGGGPVGQHPTRPGPQDVLGAVGRGQVQGDRGADGLAGHGERFAARGEDPQPAAAGEQVVDQGGAGLQQVFAVVEHEQGVTCGQARGEGVEDRPARSGGQSERGGDGRGHEFGIGHGVQLDGWRAGAQDSAGAGAGAGRGPGGGCLFGGGE
ncbi:hypothetical protein VR45_33030, partial [Streptomyces sp. NRRL S-495]